MCAGSLRQLLVSLRLESSSLPAACSIRADLDAPPLCSVENKGSRKVFLPNKLLEGLPRLSRLPSECLRWNTNEVTPFASVLCQKAAVAFRLRSPAQRCSAFLQEIAAYLVSFDRHDEWLSCTLKTR